MAGSMNKGATAHKFPDTTSDPIDSSSDVLEDMRLIVVGKTGNGKSSTINTIAGEKIFVAKLSQLSVTKQCQAAEIDFEGTHLLVVDTPELHDGNIKEEIAKIKGITSPGFHAVIIVVKVGRFTAEEIRTIEFLVGQFGSEFYNRAVILFTSTDDLDAEGMSFDEYIKGHTHSELNKIISKCRSRTVGFNNLASEEARQVQVRNLMSLIQNIIRAHNRFYFTNDEYIWIENMLKEERQKRVKNGMKTEEQATREIRKEIEENRDFGKYATYQIRNRLCVVL